VSLVVNFSIIPEKICKLFAAAHCVKPKSDAEDSEILMPADITVLLGAFNLDKSFERGKTSSSVLKIFIHEDWKTDGVKIDADLAMLELEDRVKTTNVVQPICLWTSSDEPTSNYGELVGWSQDNRVHDHILKKTTVPIHSNEDCFLTKSHLAYISSKRTFCAGSRDSSDVCLGDGAHGLFIKERGKFYLKGIMSLFPMYQGTCDFETFSTYTNILKFKDWIKDAMNGNGERIFSNKRYDLKLFLFDSYIS
jgi:secreted trypsin-like serine protease